MRYPESTAEQRMAEAKVSGAVKRLGYDRERHLPLEGKLAELHAITQDPVVFGHCLGDCLANIDEGESRFQACADLLRAAGADEAAAAEKKAWRLWQWNRRRGGGFTL